MIRIILLFIHDYYFVLLTGWQEDLYQWVKNDFDATLIQVSVFQHDSESLEFFFFFFLKTYF